MRRLLPISLLVATACGRGGSTALSTPKVDTLPGGIVEVKNDGPSAWADTDGWKLQPATRVSSGDEGPGSLSNPQAVAVGAFGQVYVAEPGGQPIQLFDSTGRFVRTIGRSGGGPGEYRSAFVAASGRYLFVHDPAQSRTSAFDTSGTFLTSWPSSCCFFDLIRADTSRRVIIPMMITLRQGDTTGARWDRFYLRSAADGSGRDTLSVPKGGDPKYWTMKRGKVMVMSTTIPFVPAMVSATGVDGNLLYGWSGGYRIAVSRGKGDTLAVFGRRWTATPISEKARREAIAERKQGFKGQFDDAELDRMMQFGDVPATAPAFDWIGEDARGDRWVRTPDPGDSLHAWFDVFDHRGAYLGRVVGPKQLLGYGLTIAGDRLIGTAEGSDGLPVVAVYRIDRRGH